MERQNDLFKRFSFCVALDRRLGFLEFLEALESLDDLGNLAILEDLDSLEYLVPLDIIPF